MSEKNGLSSYRKKNVDAYLDELQTNHQIELEEKDKEYRKLSQSYDELKQKHAELSAEVIELQKDKSRVANVLLDAETQAAAIIEQARGDAEKEKAELMFLLEKLREEIIDRNRLVQDLKRETLEACAALKAKIDETAAYAAGELDQLQARYPVPEDGQNSEQAE